MYDKCKIKNPTLKGLKCIAYCGDIDHLWDSLENFDVSIIDLQRNIIRVSIREDIILEKDIQRADFRVYPGWYIIINPDGTYLDVCEDWKSFNSKYNNT